MNRVRKIVAGTFAAALLLQAAGLAGADDISNNIDASVDATAEEMNLTAGGSTGSTVLRVVQANGDGKNGCNLTGSTTLTVTVGSSDTSKATVNPSSVTFDSCDATRTVTVTPVAAGRSTVSLSQFSNTTGGTFNLAPATFTVNVAAATSAPAPADPPPPADTTAPTWNCTPAAASSGWQAIEGSHSCTASDPSGLKADSPPEFTLTTSVSAGNENGDASTGGQLLCDVHNNCTTAVISGWKVDRKAPSITDGGPTTHPNDAGWYNADVTNNFSALDGGSGLTSSVSGPFTRTTTGEGTAVTVSSGAVADVVGNSNPGIESAAFRIDKTAPNAPVATAAPSPVNVDGTDWWKAPVTISFAVNGDPDLADGNSGSGVDASTLSASRTFDTTGPHTLSGTVKDNAGNVSVASTLGVLVDADAPTASFTNCPTNPVAMGSRHTVDWTAEDVGSGLATAGSGSVPLDTTSVGPKIVPGPAPADNVGNTGTAPSCSYSVVYSSTGVLQPINSNGSSVFKIKSTIPVKIQLTGDSAGTPNGKFTISLSKLAGTIWGTDDESVISTSAHSGTTMRYDSSADQYIFNLGTSKLTAGTYRVTVTLDDGTIRTAEFGLRS